MAPGNDTKEGSADEIVLKSTNTNTVHNVNKHVLFLNCVLSFANNRLFRM